MSPKVIKNRIRAIVMFGPATVTSGFRPAEYYQVIIDPAMQSPRGEFIRFDHTTSEIHGWQRMDGLTICEILETLGDSDEEIEMMVVD